MIWLKKHGYLAGEIAKIFGITIETVRYYHKIGLLNPVRDRENNYRYFGQSDVSNVHSVTLMRSFGIPIEKIKAFSETGDLHILRQQVTENQKELHEQIARLYRQQLELERFQKQLEDVHAYSLEITLRRSPGWYAACEQDERDLAALNRSFRAVMDGVEYLPSYAYWMEKESFLSQRFQYHRYGLLLEAERGRVPEGSRFIPPRLCAYYVFKGKEEQLAEAYGKLFRWIGEKNYAISDDIVERFILSTPRTSIMEIWVPIEDDQP